MPASKAAGRKYRALPLLLAALALPLQAQKFYTYVTDLGPDYVELSWGTTTGANTIGRSSPSHGEATVLIAGKTLLSRGNSIIVGNLAPDHDYTYKVTIGANVAGQGEVRTWASKAQSLTFFVIGDFGTGKPAQYSIARAMWDEFQRRAKTDNPVRFILSVGDNIYGDVRTPFYGFGHTGSKDEDWGPKFFEPYEPLIARIPFFPSLGNHDGSETEKHGDLAAMLDNFAYPQGKPGRYYDFTYGDLARFFALDSTSNVQSGSSRPAYLEDSEQFHWMQTEFAKPHPPWVIPFFHHPMFTSGPEHPASLEQLRHWLRLFAASGAKVVFNGHEHNFQVSEANEQTAGITFIVSGAGGELHRGNVQGKMKRANIRAWAEQNHFLEVQIDGKTMKVTPLSFEPVSVTSSDGGPVALPIAITIP
jgi:tartrate-resistant acid phosphatase type 5